VFLLFFLSGTFATLVYVAYETVLPISLADSHGLAPSTWGFLVVVNPLTVTLFQLRITARTAHVRVRDRRDALDPDLADRGGAHRARRHARRLHRRDTAMWLLFTGLAVAGAIIGFAACTRAFGLTRAARESSTRWPSRRASS